jgi:16S rRNA (guanine966-N2)-methyltransferase
MRIIGGEFGGRRLKPPEDRRVRPTADRIREAWFNILGDEVVGARVVDLFAGAGALGLEAISRGARRGVFVEVGRSSLSVLRRNVATLGVEHRAKVVKGDAMRYIRRIAPGTFDIAFADPPYDSGHALELIEVFREAPFARILGVEHRASDAVQGDETRRYGDVAITFCRAGNEELRDVS